MKKHQGIIFSSLLVCLVLVFVLDIATGSVHVPLVEVVKALTGRLSHDNGWYDIVVIFRLPKAICATAAGAGLAVSGLMMQTLFRNPLAGPSVLGITSGASLGVALVVLGTGVGVRGAGLLSGLVGLDGNLLMVAASAIGAALVLLLVLLVARLVENIMTVLIVGILGGFAISSVVSVLIHFSRPEMVQAYLAWTFGSFGSVTWRQIWIFVPVVALPLLASMLLGKPLNGLLLGDAYARSMGVSHWRLRLLVLFLTAMMVGSVTAFCGPVGFIGIAVPHLSRAALDSSDHRSVMPATVFAGAIVALLADLVAQLPGCQAVLPLNAVTALIGSPVIIWFILKRQMADAFPA